MSTMTKGNAVYEQGRSAAGGRGGCSTRRAVLAAVVAGGAGVAVSGCAVYGDESDDAATLSGGSADAAGGVDSGAAGGASGSGGGEAIAQVGDVPVGSGVILADRKIVLTQPSAGTVRAFSAVCTHAGCTVSGISGDTITCPCHGSAFRVADGSVAKGPASRPLPGVGVEVDGDAIRLA